MKTHHLFGGVASVALVLSLAGYAQGQEATPAAQSSNAGKACTITSGANEGKPGTITIEEGTTNEWCEGSSGNKDWGTQCSSGGTPNGKCNIAKVVVAGGRLPTLTIADRQVLQSYAIAATSGADALADWAAKNQARVVSRSGSAVTLSVAGNTFVIDGNVKGLAAARIR